MALNLGKSSGDFLPFLKFNAKAGRFYKREGEQDVEVSSPVFVADFGNIKTGWFLYQEGQAPSIVYDANLSTPAAQPSEKHKRGFKVNVYSEKTLGGLVEFAGASMHLSNAISEVYEAYEQDAAKNQGKMPVVACTEITPQKDKMGTNYKPTFVIQKWVDAPEAFSKQSAPAQNNAAPAPVVATSAAATSEF